jgi:phosphatidylglycerophosphate synthase
MKWTTQYRNSLKPVITEEPVDLFFYRPAGFVLAKSLEHTPFTPNQVTAVSMLFGVAAGILLATGHAHATFTAGILFLLANLLDCTDGQLARLKSVHSELGRIMDGLSDYISGAAMLLGMGIGYAGTFCHPGLWWALVLAASVSNTVQSILVDMQRNHHLALEDGFSPPSDLRIEIESYSNRFRQSAFHSFDRFVLGAYLFYLRIAVRISPAMPERDFPMDRSKLLERNRPLIRAWTLIGSSTRISIAAAACLFNRPDLYLLTVVGPFNVAAFILAILQHTADSRKGD